MSEKIKRDETGAYTGTTLERFLDSTVALRNEDVELVLDHCAPAFVYEGHWVVDCSAELCLGAELLVCCGRCRFPQHAKRPSAWRQPDATCSACGTVTKVLWPVDAEEIDKVLAARPGQTTRNWAPGGHRQSVLSGVLVQQTVDDLRRENAEHNL